MCVVLWPWLQASEPIAVWLEAIALIAIFFLDWKEKKENRKERREQHKEPPHSCKLLKAKLRRLKCPQKRQSRPPWPLRSRLKSLLLYTVP